MKCSTCKKERDEPFFLPCPGSIEHHKECVFCMYEHHKTLVEFLEGAINSSRPDQHIQNTSGILRQVAGCITCVEKRLDSMEQLKAELGNLFMRPHQQQHSKDIISIEFKCSGAEECAFQGVTIQDSKEGHFLLQIIRPHTCSPQNRSLERELKEVGAFKRFVDKLELCVPAEILDEVNGWSKDYYHVSSIYKTLQEKLHKIEDEAIKEVWGMPCRWRRGRGEQNQPPTDESDMVRLGKIIRQKKLDGKELEDYVAAGFHTDKDSPYFQPRGYFLLLACASDQILYRILEGRIQIMMYARSLLESDMFLMCYSRLNCTMLRNHAWIVLLLLYLLRAKRGLGPFPLMGFTEPKDSESLNFYDILDQLSPEFFTFL